MMKKNKQSDLCATCGSQMEQGKTTFTVDYGSGVVVVRNVPAMICTHCGSEWIDDQQAEKIEKIVDEAKSQKRELEVMSLPA